MALTAGQLGRDDDKEEEAKPVTDPSATAGYSGTPLPRKLGLKDGSRVLFIALPGDLTTLTKAADFADVTVLADAGSLDEHPAPADLAHLFTARRAELSLALPRLMEAIRPDGAIWVSWPKKASKAPTDITEGTIREVALPLGLVDVKVCAVDQTLSGLKLVIRKSRR